MIKLSESTKSYPVIGIGKLTEYGHKTLQFDLSEYIENYGEGTVSAVFTPIYSTSYLLSYTFTDGILSVPITATETATAGLHTLSINYYPTDAKIIVAEFKVKVSSVAETTTGDAPEAEKSWIDEATALLEELKNTGVSDERIATALESYLEKNPFESYDDTDLSDRVTAIESKESVWNAKATSASVTAEKTRAEAAEAELSESLSETKEDLSDLDKAKVGYAEVDGSTLNLYADSTKATLIKSVTLPSGGTSGITEERCKEIVESYGYATTDSLSVYLKSTDLADWAKASVKPTYTADEVGALPDSTVIPTVPDTLPNPYKLTLTGAVSAEYDGSKDVSVEIPEGGSGSTKFEYSLILEEDVTAIDITVDIDEYPDLIIQVSQNTGATAPIFQKAIISKNKLQGQNTADFSTSAVYSNFLELHRIGSYVYYSYRKSNNTSSVTNNMMNINYVSNYGDRIELTGTFVTGNKITVRSM